MLIHEECGNLKAVIDAESLLENLIKWRSQAFHKPINVHPGVKCCRREYFFNNQEEYCDESVR